MIRKIGYGMVLALTSTLLSSSAQANNFVMVNGVKTMLFLDRDSIVRTGNTIKASVITVYTEPSEQGVVAYSANREFSCSNNQMRDIRTTYFFANETTRQDNRTEKWMSVKPDTVGESLINEACNSR